MKPIKRTYAELTDELHAMVRAWKYTHRLNDTQVVTLLAHVASDYAPSAYVDQSRLDKETDR